MNVSAQLSKTANPLCVDLDGTLVATDLLHESVFQLLRLNVFYAFLLPLWLMKGKAHLKREIARRVTIDVETLPWNKQLKTFIEAERTKGRKAVLVTASDELFAKAVAEHLGIFDEVLASDGKTNLRSGTKAQKLAALYGERGFDYVGNSRDDVAVWDTADNAIVVGDEPAALAYANSNPAARILENSRPSKLTSWLRAIRIHQWLKNTLILVPFVLAGNLLQAEPWIAIGQAFLAFSLCASGIYLLNDLVDLQADRQHSRKRNRPLASGAIAISSALMVSGALLISAFLVARNLPVTFTIVLAVYFVMTTSYSFYLKRKLLLDVLMLAGLFTIRVFAGAAALGDTVSAWLLAFSVFFFLSLALVKRFVELSSQKVAADGKVAGRGYRPEDLETLSQSGIASGFASVLVLALFVDAPETRASYHTPELVWLVCPLVLYIVVRMWILARRQEMNDDPVVFLMSDWRSQAMIGAGALTILAAKLF